MAKIYSVTKLNSYIKNMFNMDFALSKLSIGGELSNVKYHGLGHIYFTLKDDNSQINAVMFAFNTKNLKVKLSNGMKVVVTGKVEVYEKGGTYQIYASNIEEAGLGDLYEKYLVLKNDLEKKGLFDSINKKELPKFATKIGIVTSETGAAIQDIINVSKRRNPYVSLYLYPALVQGENASKSIVKAIEYLDKMDLDIIIVGRGGGSIEDLWAFNEENVAMAIFYANTPIISAVGHETDFTIADFVADFRAATPSQAAELANFDYKNFEMQIKNLEHRMSTSLISKLNILKNRTQNYYIRLSKFSPSKIINSYRIYLNDLYTKLDTKYKNKLDKAKANLSLIATRLENLSPLKLLASGYAYVADDKGNRINSIESIEKENIIDISFKDGKAKAKVLDIIGK